MRKNGKKDRHDATIVCFKNVENAPKNKMNPIIEHNTQTYLEVL